MANLTQRTLQSAAAGRWISDGGTRGGGTLVARKLSGGTVLFYFRYTNPTGSREAIPLGEWSGTGGAMSLEGARDRANALSARYRAGDRNLSAVLSAEEREAERKLHAARQAYEEAQARQTATLGALLDAYVIDLRKRGKLDSARDTASAVKRHVTDCWPQLVATPADDVRLHDLLGVTRRVASQGKLNEARKLRSYLRAAYTAGMNAQQDATACEELLQLRITQNPARDLAPIKGAAKAGTRCLSLAELRAYWKRINARKDNIGAAFRFLLLTGAQRQKQLARATLADLDTSRQTLTIFDGKGRRSEAVPHVIPLIPDALRALQEMAPERFGNMVFSLTYGRTGLTHGDLSRHLHDIVEEMDAAGELEHGSFTLADLRRTVETQLAAARVSKDLRSQLQSHGRGGVQARHYDRHDYYDEKREALELLHQLTTGEPAAAVSIQSKRRAS